MDDLIFALLHRRIVAFSARGNGHEYPMIFCYLARGTSNIL